jgi:hypothetical protein
MQSQPDSRITLARKKWLTIACALELNVHGWFVPSMVHAEWNLGFLMSPKDNLAENA